MHAAMPARPGTIAGVPRFLVGAAAAVAGFAVLRLLLHAFDAVVASLASLTGASPGTVLGAAAVALLAAAGEVLVAVVFGAAAAVTAARLVGVRADDAGPRLVRGLLVGAGVGAGVYVLLRLLAALVGAAFSVLNGTGGPGGVAFGGIAADALTLAAVFLAAALAFAALTRPGAGAR